jgi:hypothetical protein
MRNLKIPLSLSSLSLSLTMDLLLLIDRKKEELKNCARSIITDFYVIEKLQLFLNSNTFKI